MKGSGVVKVDKDHAFFFCGSEDSKHHEVGMLVNRALKPQYTTNTIRICQIKCDVKEKPLICICTYAPRETSSNKDPEERNNYNEELEDIIRSVPLSNILIICSDMKPKADINFILV